MQKLTIGTLRKYSEWYDYGLTEEQLREAYMQLTWGEGFVKENEILDEFEEILSS